LYALCVEKNTKTIGAFFKICICQESLHLPVVTLHPNGVGLLGENRVKYAEYSS
jgi:hypothetical protein